MADTVSGSKASAVLGSDPVPNPDTHLVDYVINRYARARAWADTSEMLAGQFLHHLCLLVINQHVSLREAAARAGMSKSTLGRMVERVKAGEASLVVSEFATTDVFTTVANDLIDEPLPSWFEMAEVDGRVVAVPLPVDAAIPADSAA